MNLTQSNSSTETKQLKKLLEETYQFQQSEWNEDDITDILRIVKGWLKQKKQENIINQTYQSSEFVTLIFDWLIKELSSK